MTCDFSYKHYREMLKKALKEGFIITNFRDYEKNKKAKKLIILRHDVDYSPKRDLAIAKIEKSLGLKSTFFVRVHGEHYHPFDRGSYPVFKEILQMGHEIGLHYEARTLSKFFQNNAIALFRKEKKILEEIFNIKIESASEHRDLRGKKLPYKFFASKNQLGIKHETYEKDFQKFYLADSSGRWSQGCLCQNLHQKRIQLLTHPDLWGKGAIKEVRDKISKIGLKPTY